MQRLIASGKAFAHSKGKDLKVTVECGCNCKCCHGQKETDFWELSKKCGCDCGCCNHKETEIKQAPQFFIDRKGAEQEGKELVKKNLKLEGEALDDYMNRNFGEIWDHYDVLNQGQVEIEQMSSFYKKLLKDFTIQIQ